MSTIVSNISLLSESAGEISQYTCSVCGIEFSEPEPHRAHFKSEWHIYNTKRRVAGLQVISETTWEEKLAAIRSQQSLVQQQIADKRDAKSAKKYVEGVETRADVFIAPPCDEKTCFFDSSMSESLEDNLAHMSLKHSFFIPYIEWVSNWAGLMKHLCERVLVNHQCITCGKIFKSALAVQGHMSDSGHTRINLDDEDFIGDLETYYDFSTKEEIVDELDILEDGSLQLPSGGVLTHRDFAYIYKQKLSKNPITHTPNPRNQRTHIPSLLNVGPHGGNVSAIVPAESLKKLAKQLAKAMKIERDRQSLAVGVRNNKTMRRSYRSSIVEMYSYGK